MHSNRFAAYGLAGLPADVVQLSAILAGLLTNLVQWSASLAEALTGLAEASAGLAEASAGLAEALEKLIALVEASLDSPNFDTAKQPVYSFPHRNNGLTS